MSVPTLTLQRSEGQGREKKTRTFSVKLLGFLTADSLWDSGSAEEIRPVWISYLGTESQTQAFTANFRGGRKAKLRRDTVQMLKTAPYRWATQKVPGGVVTTAYLPELFHLEPAEPSPARVRFVFAPPRWWVEHQARLLEADFGEEAAEVARAALFAAYLDRRTPLPLLGELAFHLELYRAARETDWVHASRTSLQASSYTFGPLYAEGAETCGFDEVMAVSADPATLADFLVHQTSLYRPEETLHVAHRIPTNRWLLPDPEPPAALHQLRLALA